MGPGACARRKSQDRAQFHSWGPSLSLFWVAAWSRATIDPGLCLGHYFGQFFLRLSFTCLIGEMGVISVQTAPGRGEDYMNRSINVASLFPGVFAEHEPRGSSAQLYIRIMWGAFNHPVVQASPQVQNFTISGAMGSRHQYI